MSTLTRRSQRLLLLRAGITLREPASRRTVARTLRIRPAQEAGMETVALRGLETAARKGRCGSTPAWIHVPAANRLVPIDVALTTLPAIASHASLQTTSSPVRADALTFTPAATGMGSPLVSDVDYTPGKSTWAAAR
jgi:hypothetical protein